MTVEHVRRGLRARDFIPMGAAILASLAGLLVSFIILTAVAPPLPVGILILIVGGVVPGAVAGFVTVRSLGLQSKWDRARAAARENDVEGVDSVRESPATSKHLAHRIPRILRPWWAWVGLLALSVWGLAARGFDLSSAFDVTATVWMMLTTGVAVGMLVTSLVIAILPTFDVEE